MTDPRNDGRDDPGAEDPAEIAPFTPEGDDALAAEYVLGVLPLPERLAFEERLKAERVLRYRVDRWQARLEPLNEAYDEVPAPNLLPAVEARLFGAKPARSRGRFRFGILGGALAASLALAVGLSFLPPTEVRLLRATLAANEQPVAFAAAYDPSSQMLTVTRLFGAAAAEGRDYQLWLIVGENAPVSLGLIRTEQTIAASPVPLTPGMTLAVSLEPAGGSTSGQPTGPVLVAGVVAAL